MRIGSLLSPARQSPICEPRRRLAWKRQTYQILPKRIAVVFVHDSCRGVACARALRRQFYVGVLSPKLEPKRSVKFYQTPNIYKTIIWKDFLSCVQRWMRTKKDKQSEGGEKGVSIEDCCVHFENFRRTRCENKIRDTSFLSV